MADESGTDGAADGEKKGKGKLIMIVVGAVVVLGGGYFFLGGGGGGEAEAEDAVTTTTVPVEGMVIEADTMTVNLADEDGRYARITFAVVLPVGADSGAVGQRMPLLKDAALTVMSTYTADDLYGADGLTRLRDELTEAAMTVYEEGEVLRVVLTEVLVQ